MTRLLRVVRVSALCLLVLAAFSYHSRIVAQPEGLAIFCKKSSFSPTEIRVKQGVTTRVVLTSKDVTHGFAIDELGIAREVAPGQPVTVKITAEKAGRYPFYCVVRCGRDHLKMRGVLVVE